MLIQNIFAISDDIKKWFKKHIFHMDEFAFSFYYKIINDFKTNNVSLIYFSESSKAVKILGSLQ